MRKMLVLAVIASGCSGSGVGVEVKATNAGQTAEGRAITVVDAQGSEVVVEEARLSVEEIRLELPDGVSCADVAGDLSGAVCHSDDDDVHGDDDDDGGSDDHGDDGEIRVEGPFLVDLIRHTSEPDLGAVRIPDLAYDEVKIRLGRSAELGGKSFVISGSVDGEPMTIALRIDDDIEIEEPGGVRTSASAPLLVELDASRWFAALSLRPCLGASGLSVDDDGEDDCDLEDDLEKALEESCDVDRDDDDD